MDEDIGRIQAGWFAATDAFLLGRKTYEPLAAYWPHVTDENDRLATRLNGLPKYVVSTTLEKAEWNNSILIDGDVAEEVAKLKCQPGNEIQVIGSGTLVRTLLEYDLVDEYRLCFHPVVLGNGKRLFTDGTVPTALELIDIKTTSSGVVVHVYQPAGKPEYGSVALEQDGAVVSESLSRRLPPGRHAPESRVHQVGSTPNAVHQSD